MSMRRLLIPLVALSFVAAACTGGPGSRDDLVAALTRDETFTTEEAQCIANAVFDRYSDDEDVLGQISGAVSYEELTGTSGVEGFEEFFENTVTACANL
ncbi:MAG: hypothetical protein AAF467_03925 [Actinomycetota bacterium]